jgi:hypothetical protein
MIEYTCNYNETPCIAILNKQKMSFFKNKNSFCPGRRYHEKWGGYKERV